MEYEKLSEYAKRVGFQYRTVWNWYKAGKIPGAKNINGNIVVPIEKQTQNETNNIKIITYARISSSENKLNLKTQNERLYNYSIAKGYTIIDQITEIGSGLNEQRPKLKQLFENPEWNILIVEHKDRLTRFGYEYLKMLVKVQGRTIEIINHTDNKEEELMTDLIAIITSFCARLYGLRRSKRKTEKIIKQLTEEK